MNIQHLKYALEVERTGSISQAAESLYMGQPNLSRALKELESTCGIIIFKRTSKGVVPTDRGREFLANARHVVKQVEEMERKYRPGNPDYQSFSISIPRASYISLAFAEFVGKLSSTPEIELDFMETNSMLAISNVLEGKTNLGIIRYQVDYENYFLNFLKEKGLYHDIIWEFRYLVLLSRSHPLATLPEVSLEQLRDYIEITHGDLSIPYLSHAKPTAPDAGQPSARRIHVYERGSQFDLLTHNADTYIFVSPLPEDLLNRLNLVQLPCPSATGKYKDVLIYAQHYKFTDLDRQFVQQLYQTRDQLNLLSLGKN